MHTSLFKLLHHFILRIFVHSETGKSGEDGDEALTLGPLKPCVAHAISECEEEVISKRRIFCVLVEMIAV
jgi:hypothetical protein